MEITQYTKTMSTKTVVVSGVTADDKDAARAMALTHAGEREGSIFGSNSHFGNGAWRFEFWTD